MPSKKRIINFRPTVICCFLFLLGIVCAYLFFINFRFALPVLFCCLLAATISLFACKRKKVALFLLVTLLFFSAGVSLFFAEASKLDSYSIGTAQTTISGKIDRVNVDEEGKIDILIADVTAQLDGQSKKLAGKTRVFLGGDFPSVNSQLSQGNIVNFDCTINDIYILRDGVQTYQYKHNIYYQAYGVQNFSSTQGQLSFRQKAVNYIKDSISDNMSQDGASVGTALVLGDTSLLAQDDLSAFRKSGVAHVLAVSGLHVGFVVTAISYLLFVCRVRQKWRYPIIAIPLFAYAFLVGFSPSVFRALVMTLVVLALNHFGRPSDILTSLAIAVFVILVIRPLYLFDAAFLLSVSAVYGIATIGKFFNSKVAKLNTGKFVKNILSACIVCFAATVGTLPAVALFFGELSLVGLLVNLPVVPIVSVVFTVILAGLVLFPLATPLLWLADKGIMLILFIVRTSSSLSFATSNINPLGFVSVILFATMFVAFGYVRMSRRARCAVILCAVSLMLPLYVFSCMKQKPKDFLNYYAGQYGNAHSIAMSRQQNLYFFSSLSTIYDFYLLEDLCQTYNFESVCAYIINPSETSPEVFVCASEYVQDYFLIADKSIDHLSQAMQEHLIDKPIYFAHDKIVTRIDFYNINGFVINFGNSKILIAQKIYDNLFYTLPNIDVIVTQKFSQDLLQFYPHSIIFSIDFTTQEGYLNITKCGNFTIQAKDDRLVVKP